MAQHMDMNKMMKQAQQMRKDLEKAQQEIAEQEVTATSGGGMVSVTVTGDLTVKEVVIDPAAVDPEDVEMLQDMIVAATNEALRSVQDLSNSRLGGIAGGLGGLGIPGLF